MNSIINNGKLNAAHINNRWLNHNDLSSSEVANIFGQFSSMIWKKVRPKDRPKILSMKIKNALRQIERLQEEIENNNINIL